VYISGEYAPWSAGNLRWGNLHARVFALPELAGAAVGIELRQPTSCDPPGVLDLRYRLVNILQCWRRNSTTGDCDPVGLFQRELVNDGSVLEGGGECRKLVRSYPWGRSFSTASSQRPDNPTSSFMSDWMLYWALGTLLLLLVILLAVLIVIDYRLGVPENTETDAVIWCIYIYMKKGKLRLCCRNWK
jgi:hypothetical protein